MNRSLAKRWPLLAILLIFTISKLPHLAYPYYWDESWPYAAAIKHMYSQGISLLPSAMDGELSRGHPLFFHAIAASWMDIFGPSHISMHTFALVISLLFLITIYEAGLRLFNIRVAIITVLLVATQMIFFIQSSFVLFDMLVAFLCFASIFSYAHDRYLLTVCCLTMLFYTKESGLIAGFVLGLDAAAGLLFSHTDRRKALYRTISVAVPCMLVAIFSIIQKYQRGWYILPLYNDLIEHRWDQFWYRFRIGVLRTVFTGDYRYYLFSLLLVLSILAAIMQRNARFLAILLPAVCIYYFVDDTRSGRIMPGIPFFIVFIISIGAMLLLLIKLKFFENVHQRKFILLLVFFTFCYLCFSAMNFLTARYLLAAIVPLLFFTAVLIDSLAERTFQWLLYVMPAMALGIFIYNYQTDTGLGDCDPGAFAAMRVEQEMITWLGENNDYGKSIGCGFLLQQHLADPGQGYLKSGTHFTNVHWDMTKGTDLFLFDNHQPDYRDTIIKRDTNNHLLYRCQKGQAWAEVWGRQH